MDNEFAFPIDPDWPSDCCGMTMRDYFAAKAMHGLFGRDLGIKGDLDKYILAEMAYEYADAMIKVRGE